MLTTNRSCHNDFDTAITVEQQYGQYKPIIDHKKFVLRENAHTMGDITTYDSNDAYLIENKIMFFNDDTESGGDVVKFDMMDLKDENIRILNKIIKDNYKIKVVKAVKVPKSLPVKNYNYELILFDDD